MSAVGGSRQRWGAAAWRAASWPARLLHVLLRVALVLAVVLLAGVAALAWRLSQGPLDVAWLARRIEAAAFPAGAPARLAIGEASIAWNGFHEGSESGLELRLRDLRVVDGSGAPGARVAEADVTVSLLRLLEAKVVPRSVVLDGLRLRGVRALDGTITLDLGAPSDTSAAGPGDAGGPGLGDALAELRQPAASDRRQGAPGLETLAQLQQVQVHDAQLVLVDQQSGATLRADIADLDLQRQPGGGVKGQAAGQLGLGDALASLRLQADLLAGGGTHVEAQLAPLQAAAVAQSNPALAPLGALDAALQAEASLDLSPSLRPRAAELHASTGAGTLSLADATVTFERLALDATGTWSGASWRPDRLAVQRAQVVLPAPGGGSPTTLALTGEVARQAGKVEARADLNLDHAAFADLPALWPAAWGGNVRPWLVENVTGGIARDGVFSLKITASEDDLAAATLADASGTLQGDDVTIHWLRPVPPIEHAQALLKVVGPDVIEVAVPAASQGGIALKDGLVRFTGLAGKDQFMSITTGVQGPVPDVLQLLRHPRLRLLDRHPLPIKSSAGALAGKLSVDLPLIKQLDFDEVKIAAQGRLSALRLGGLVAGRDLDRGDIQFDVTQDGLKVSGAASVASIAGTIGVEMDFRAGPPTQVVQRATMTGKATVAQMTKVGVDPGGLITAGRAAVSATYVAQRDGSAQVAAKADLTEAGLTLLGWRKPPGPAAEASATALLKNDKLAGISGIQAHGPGMEVIGRADMVGGRPLLLRLEKVVLGPTQASGEIHFAERPGDPIRVRVGGRQLDLSTELSAKPSRSAGQDNPPWIVDARFERVVLAKGLALTGVVAHAEHDGRKLRVLQANSSGPEKLQAVIASHGVGRRLAVRATDGGALLRGLDVLDTIHGGTLAVDAQYDDRYPDPPLAGTVDLSNFGVNDAVVLGKLLQALTIYGIPEALTGEGVHFTRLIMPFQYTKDVLRIGESQAFSASLGLTAHGWIDSGRKLMDVRGTVVPAYVLNSALGRIPLIGRLFSAEKGGGLVAVNYSVSGNLSDPGVTVNPLSALTPGILRGLFKIFN